MRKFQIIFEDFADAVQKISTEFTEYVTELDNNKTDHETAQRVKQLHKKLYEEVMRLTDADTDLQAVFEESHKGLIMKLSNKFK